MDPQSISSESYCSMEATASLRSNNNGSVQDSGTPSIVLTSPLNPDHQRIADSYAEWKPIPPLKLDHQRIASTLPQPMDIVCGRGSRVSSNPGNRRFQRAVEKRKAEYQCAVRREEKSRITMEIIHQLTQGTIPSRFMLKDPDTLVWYIVGLDYAKEKVSHALRSRSLTEEERQQRKAIRQLQQQKERQRKQNEKNLKESNMPQQSAKQNLQSAPKPKAVMRRRGTQCDPARLPREMEHLVKRMINDQQRLLASMIRRHRVVSLSDMIYTPTHSPKPSSNIVSPPPNHT